MNKSIIIVIAMITVMTLLLTGCFSTPKVETDATEQTRVENTIATERQEETIVVTLPEGEGLDDSADLELGEETQESSKNTEKDTEPAKNTEPANNSDPKETEPQKPTDPIETTPSTESTEPDNWEPEKATAYEEYMSMSPQQQQAVFESFSSPAEFIDWMNNARAEYDAKNNVVSGEDGNIDIGDYIK